MRFTQVEILVMYGMYHDGMYGMYVEGYVHSRGNSSPRDMGL